jgi:hypothetical protein
MDAVDQPLSVCPSFNERKVLQVTTQSAVVGRLRSGRNALR